MFGSPSAPSPPTVAQAGPPPPNPPMYGANAPKKPTQKGTPFNASVIGTVPTGTQLAQPQATGQRTVLGV